MVWLGLCMSSLLLYSAWFGLAGGAEKIAEREKLLKNDGREHRVTKQSEDNRTRERERERKREGERKRENEKE